MEGYIGPYQAEPDDKDPAPPAYQPPTREPTVSPPALPGTLDPPPSYNPEIRPVDLAVLPGYKHVPSRIDSHVIPSAPPLQPPTYDDVCGANFTYTPEEFTPVAHITEEEARETLMRMVAKHCCYGKSAAKKLTIRNITSSNALHLTLETFTETRTTERKKVPHIVDTPVDGPLFGPPPAPWDIVYAPAELFRDEIHIVEVPHTSEVVICPQCAAAGTILCPSCFGSGHTACHMCNGSGRTVIYAEGRSYGDCCNMCCGTGRRGCTRCHTTGRIICIMCEGHREIRFFIQLQIVFKNNKSDHIIDRTDMTASLVRTAQGQTIFEQTLPRVGPITTHPDQEICEASQKLISNDGSRFSQTRILMQRQRLRSVPVSECAFNYKGKDGRFWVYGNEKDVEAPDYPDQCCWGCEII